MTHLVPSAPPGAGAPVGCEPEWAARLRAVALRGTFCLARPSISLRDRLIPVEIQTKCPSECGVDHPDALGGWNLEA
jgi:hypothetical protein